MMAKSSELIRLSALGRFVRVGDFYNYFNDEIFLISNSDDSDQVPQKVVKTELIITRTFFFQQPEKYKHLLLGINTHLYQNIQKGCIKSDNLWFNDFLKENGTRDNTPLVCVFLRVVQRIETLDQHSHHTLIYQKQLQADRKETHLVEQVVYGTEFICLMKKTINQPITNETKASIEGNIYWLAKSYFDRSIELNLFNEQEIPVELDRSISCTIYSSRFRPGEVLERRSFQEFILFLNDTISNVDSSFHRPIEISLRYIPCQFKHRLDKERRMDFELEKERHQVIMKRILQDSHLINNNLLLHRAPPLEMVSCHSLDLLRKLNEKIMIPDNIGGMAELMHISTLFTEVTDWLIYLRKEIENIFFLLKGIKLAMMDYNKIKSIDPSNVRQVEIFILKVHYTPVQFMENIQKMVCDSAPPFQFPVFTIFTRGNEHTIQVKNKLNEFANKAQNCKRNSIWYCIGLVEASSLIDDGVETTIELLQQVRDQTLDNSAIAELTKDTTYSQNFDQTTGLVQVPGKRYYKINEMENDYSCTFGGDNLQLNYALEEIMNYMTSDESDGNEGDISQISSDKSSNFFQSTYSEKSLVKTQHSERNSSTVEGNSSTELDVTHESETTLLESEYFRESSTADCLEKNVSIASLVKDYKNDEKSENDHTSLIHKKRVENYETSLETMKQKFMPNKRIAEIFIDKTYHYSTLITRGQPDIYLLNAEENAIGNDLRWFDIGFENAHHQHQQFDVHNHKFIILMGATGCGKSTVINGMVNYILGVKWDDPFRFEVIREDKSAFGRDQAHSQTSSVTAYTLHHHSGMTVPYSITIIDTPGYGDTRGIQRDKEITRTIHRFLTQPETQIDQIHAICFVAASGDSRLTQTQRYILDSVLSIFGKDVIDNIRLLVTFADNADPPVVKACLAAHFPVTSHLGGIAYSKFNSSVLYASNQPVRDDDFSFDELFWDMGQENFEKFFKMLEGMNGRDMTSTREVIQSRKRLEQSLKDIEWELEVCLVKIENIEKFRRKMREYEYKMEINKNYVMETTEVFFDEMDCKNGTWAYNCRRCRMTCETNISKKFSKRPCEKKMCSCPDFEHEFQKFELRQIMRIVKKTLKDMKMEFESNYDDKMTAKQLVDNCTYELQMANSKVFSLLDQMGVEARALDSTALRSNALRPADYLKLMRSQVAEDQTPGYLTRLETLDELQRTLAANANQMMVKSDGFTEPSIPKQRVHNHHVDCFQSTQSSGKTVGNEIMSSPNSSMRTSDTSSFEKESSSSTFWGNLKNLGNIKNKFTKKS